jgi:hypothetical protein
VKVWRACPGSTLDLASALEYLGLSYLKAQRLQEGVKAIEVAVEVRVFVGR